MRLRTTRLNVEQLESRSLPSTFYVATTGNDTTNNGSSASPWLTIQHAADNVGVGDTVVVRVGSYAGFVLGWDFPTSGASGSPITFEADPAAAPGTVIINARNNKTASGIDIEPGCDYITISGFSIAGGGTIAQYPNSGSGIKVTGNNDIVVNNTISNIDYGFGILADNATNVVIKNNTVSGTGNHSNSNFGHGIYVSGSTDGAVVQGNVIHDNSDIGIHVNGDLSEGSPGVVTHALIANNLIYNNGQNGINADGIQSSTIENNLIYGYEDFGIALYQIDAGGPSKNNVIVNNTIVATTAFSSPGAAIRILNAGTGNAIRNNILLGGGGYAYRISADSISGLVSDYNATGGVYQSEDTGTTETLAQWQAQTGQDAHSFISVPSALFANPSGNNYHLKPGSPAIDAGTTVSAPATDLDGNHRPQGKGFDIGAYELPANSPVKSVFAAGSGPGMVGAVHIYSARTGALLKTLVPYGNGFTGGVRVAMADVNGDGVPDIITAAGPGGGPHVEVFDGVGYSLIRSFFAYDSTFTGGVWVAGGDVNDDGFAEIVTGAGYGGGPHVKVFKGADNSVLRSFFAYSPTFTGGVQVAVGDVNGDLHADIITGAGPGGGPHVQVFDGVTGQVTRSFFAYAPTFTGGVFVAAGDVNGDGKADIVTGAGAGGGPHVQVFSGTDNSVLASFFAFNSSFSGGVRVSVADATGAGLADVVAGSGPGGAPRIRVLNPTSGQAYWDFNAFNPTFTGGLFAG